MSKQRALKQVAGLKKPTYVGNRDAEAFLGSVGRVDPGPPRTTKSVRFLSSKPLLCSISPQRLCTCEK